MINKLLFKVSSVSIFENGCFAFGTLHKPADVFLMRNHHHQGHYYSKKAIDSILFFENKENQNHKATPAKIELNDTNRVESKVIKNTTKQSKATTG